jgi:PAS domain S-box-containing protein
MQEQYLLHTMMDNLPDHIYFKDADSRFTRINKALTEWFGLRHPDEAIGKTDFDFFTQKHAQQAYSDEQDMMRSGVPIHDKEEKETWRDGRETWVSTTKVPLRDQIGRIIGTFGISRDITERKQMEEMLQKAHADLEKQVEARTVDLSEINESLRHEIAERKRAEELAKVRQQQLIQADKMASLGILVSGVAHEINNPNNFIMLNAKILAKVWNDVMPILQTHYEKEGNFAVAGVPFTNAHEKIAQLISGVSEGADRIQNIVQNLRDFSRQDQGELTQQVAINLVVKSAIVIVKTLIQKSTDRFSVQYGENLPTIRGNSQQLEQVLINLITNSCQALQERHRRVQVSTAYQVDTDHIAITVCDEGNGIPPEDLQHIIEPFFTTKRNIGGTGLGLSVSYNIIKNHGGSLDFISTPGKGTKAKVTLPAYRVDD